MEAKICAHAGCSCPVEGADYCSAECAREANTGIARSPCACGHPECGSGG